MMNINIFCRIRSSKRIDVSSKVDFDRKGTMVSRINGPSFKFNKIFKDTDDIKNVHDICLSPLINGLINGFNSSLMLFGETGSGKSYMLAGNDNDRLGIFTSAVQDMFSKLSTDERYCPPFKVYLRMFEVHDDVLVDLIKSNNTMKFSNDVVLCTQDRGFEIKGMTEVDIGSAAQAVVLFRDSWNRRILYSKSDPHLQVSTIVQIKLFLKNFQENAKDTASQISFVYFPGDESLIQPTSEISEEIKRHGIFAVGKLIDELSGNSIGHGSYSNSCLMTLLEDDIGGNCITHALLCLPSGPNPDILAVQLRTMNNLSKIKTCPIINTEYARKLIYRLKAQRNELLQGLFNDIKLRPNVLNQKTMLDDFKLTQRQNAELRDKIETLQQRLENLNNKYSYAMMDRSNISDDFIQSEEEKLRASKKIMDLEIENSKYKEKLEIVRFELSNKILHLEEKLLNSELEKSLYKEDANAFKVVKEEKDQINKQFLSLKKSFEDLQKDVDLIVSKNKELNLEFMNMLKMKRRMPKRDLESNDIEAQPEVANDKGFFSLNQSRIPLSTISSQSDTTLKLRLGKVQEILQKEREKSQERLKEMSKLSVNYITIKEENQQLNTRIKELSNTVRDVTVEYQQRLKKYAINLSKRFDNDQVDEKQYKEEIIAILKKYDSSRVVSESHLQNNLAQVKKQYDSLRRWSERIVYEYIKIRQEIINEGFTLSDMGVDPLSIEADYTLPKDYMKIIQPTQDERESSNFMELKQQIKEFSNSTQSNLEIERAQLLARNAELEEELISAHNYIEMYIKQKSLYQKK